MRQRERACALKAERGKVGCSTFNLQAVSVFFFFFFSFQGFLRNERENALLSATEESCRRVSVHFTSPSVSLSVRTQILISYLFLFVFIISVASYHTE